MSILLYMYYVCAVYCYLGWYVREKPSLLGIGGV